MAEINIEKMAQNVAKKAIQELRDNGVFVGRWFPVSERLPEEPGTYLVTLEYKEHGTGVTTLWFHGSLGWDLRVADVVTAWMPLPKPFER